MATIEELLISMTERAVRAEKERDEAMNDRAELSLKLLRDENPPPKPKDHDS